MPARDLIPRCDKCGGSVLRFNGLLTCLSCGEEHGGREESATAAHQARGQSVFRAWSDKRHIKAKKGAL